MCRKTRVLPAVWACSPRRGQAAGRFMTANYRWPRRITASPTFWRPYHDALQTLIDESHARFGQAILIDCHSMPHEALDQYRTGGRARPDVVLGDRFGAAASGAIVEQIEAAFGAAGLKVARNMPFAGAYIVQHYGRPSRKQHAVQIEIDRALYMNEATLEVNDNFAPLRALLSGVMSEITELGRETDTALAAQ